MKRVALLVPCFNAVPFVPRFTGFIRRQTQPFDEICFYDDGSKDGTADCLRATGFRVVRGEINRGAAHARNRLLAESSAEYVHFHDIDDTIDPAFVATLLPATGPNCAACCGYRRQNADGSIEREHRFNDLPSEGERVRYFLNHFLHLNAVIYPRAAIVAAGGFNETLRISEDVHLLLRLAAGGLQFAYRDVSLTTWELRSESTYHSAGRRGAALGILACLEDLCGTWPFELRRQAGPALLETAWELHTLGEGEHARRAARLAAQCGVRTITNRGRKAQVLSTLLGAAGYFRVAAAPRRTMSGL